MPGLNCVKFEGNGQIRNQLRVNRDKTKAKKEGRGECLPGFRFPSILQTSANFSPSKSYRTLSRLPRRSGSELLKAAAVKTALDPII